jgi:predicted negative regulator of RcsB-dependent stress response
MKTTRRHQLKENELAHTLGGIGEAMRTHGVTILLGVIIVAAIVIGMTVYSSNKESARQDRWATLGQAPGANLAADTLVSDLRSVASTGESATLSALAHQQAALIAVAEMRKAERESRATEAAQWRTSARESFEALKNQNGAPAGMSALADLGLAFLSENEGAYGAAKSTYEAIIANPDFADTPYAAQARHRLDGLERWRSKVEFPMPKPLIQQMPEVPTPLAPIQPNAGGADGAGAPPEAGAPPAGATGETAVDMGDDSGADTGETHDGADAPVASTQPSGS